MQFEVRHHAKANREVAHVGKVIDLRRKLAHDGDDLFVSLQCAVEVPALLRDRRNAAQQRADVVSTQRCAELGS